MGFYAEHPGITCTARARALGASPGSSLPTASVTRICTRVCKHMHAHAHTHLEKQATSLSSCRTPSTKHSFDLLSEPCDHTREMLGAGFRGSRGFRGFRGEGWAAAWNLEDSVSAIFETQGKALFLRVLELKTSRTHDLA